MDTSKYTVKLGNYKGVWHPALSVDVSEEDVDKFLERERQARGELKEVKRAAQMGDTVVIDFSGSVDGKLFEGGTSGNYPLALGSGTFIPGFEEQVAGHSDGDEFDVVVTFPEIYPAQELAGKEAIFKCKMHEVKENTVPELNDEFAKLYGKETLAELRDEARNELIAHTSQKVASEIRNIVIDQVVKESEIELMPEYLDKCVEDMKAAFIEQLQSQGASLELFLSQAGWTEEQLIDDIRPQAEQNAKSTAAMIAVAEAEGITVSEEEVENQINEIAEQYQMSLEQLKANMPADAVDNIRSGILASKGLGFVLAHAKAQEQ